MNIHRPYKDLIDCLKAAGLRPTRQRLALAKLLFAGDKRHISAECLHGEARAKGVSVSLATVYNNLNQFTAAGLLREVVVDSSRSYFDTNTTNHHHFFIEEDGRLVDIPDEELQLERLPETPKGTSIDRVDITIRLKNSL